MSTGYTRMGDSTAVTIDDQQTPKRKCSCLKILGCTFCLLLLLIVATAITLVVLVLVYYPQPPQFTLDKVTVTQITVSPVAGPGGPGSANPQLQKSGGAGDAAAAAAVKSAVTAALTAAQGANVTDALETGAAAAGKGGLGGGPGAVGPGAGGAAPGAVRRAVLDAVLNVSVSAYNPNKVGIQYKSVNVTARSGDAVVATTTVPSFHQDPKSASALAALLTVQGFPFNVTLPAAGAMAGVADVSSNLPVTVDIAVRATVDFLHMPAPYVTVRLQCNMALDVVKQTVQDPACQFMGVNL